MTQLAEVLRYELAYQWRRASTRVYLAMFASFALMLAQVFLRDARQDGYFFNAPLVTAGVTILASMFALIVAAGVAGDAAARDVETRLDVLLYATPLRKAAYLGGRFAGAFAIIAILLAAVPPVLLAAAHLPHVEPRLIGPFRPGAYLAAYAVFALPNAFVVTAVLFALAALTRRALAAYGGALLLFCVAMSSQTLVAARQGRWLLARLLDPMGLTTLVATWRSSSAAQKNTMLLPLDGALVANRLLWIAVACAALVFACTRARLAPAIEGRGADERDDAAPASEPVRATVPASRRTFGVATRLRQLRAVTARSLHMLLSMRTTLLVPLAAIVFVATAAQLLSVQLGAPGAATAARIAGLYGNSELGLLITLLIALWAGELVWRDRDLRLDALANVLPVRPWIVLAGRCLALAVLLAGIQFLFLVAGVVVQVLHGARVDVAMFAAMLLGFQFVPLLLFAAVAMALHLLVRHKHVANVAAVLVLMATEMARQLGVADNLLLFRGAPPLVYSEMSGFGGQLAPWLWCTLYWSGWALLLLLVAHGRATRTRAVGGVLLALLVIVGAGGFVFYNTHVLHPHRPSAAAGSEAPQPVLTATRLAVELYGREHALTIRGTDVLENRSGAAIDTIDVATHAAAMTQIAFDRAVRSTRVDGTRRVYELAKPLRPGEALRMRFDVAVRRSGFDDDGVAPGLEENGAWLEHRGTQTQRARQWLPVVGLAGDELRPLDDVAARRDGRGHERIALDVVVGTDAGQLGVAPGALQRTWSARGRRYAHYVTDVPVGNLYAIFSARYAVRRVQWHDVAIEVFHHPAHTANLDRMLRSVQASLAYHERHFGPYPHRQLRLVESPSGAGDLSLTSYPGLVRYSEGFALVRPDDDERHIDLPFAVLAHEVAHQWWGHQVVPARVEGAPLLTETLAWYSAMLVVEESLGREHLQRLLGVMHDQYDAPHATRGVPLLRAVDAIDVYRAGPFAMMALRDAIGARRVNAALRALLQKFDAARPPYPTSRDLLAQLRAVTPREKLPMLAELFER